MIDQFTARINELEQELEALAGRDARVGRLRTHPGIGLLTGLALAHTLSPVSRFSSGRKVAAYVGLEPCERSSADKQRWGGISKAGPRLLRYLLVEAAQSAVRGDPELRGFYQRLVYRRGHPKALVAAARKLLVRAYILLRDEIDYAEFQRRGVRSPACPAYTWALGCLTFDWAAGLPAGDQWAGSADQTSWTESVRIDD